VCSSDLGAPSADFSAEVSVVNDLMRRIPDAVVRWEVRGGGKTVIRGSRRLSVGPDSVAPVATFGVPSGLSGKYRITSSITAAGRILGTNSVEVVFK
jgi:hypothetical protein